MVVAMDPAHVEKNLALVKKSGLEAHAVGGVSPRGDGAAVRYRGELRL
jgi:hypothetical protein